MTINKGKRPIKRELGSQELKIFAQQNRKGNEKVGSLACKCVVAYAGDSVFLRWGRRPSKWNGQWPTPSPWTAKKRHKAAGIAFLLPRNKELHWKSHAIFEVMLSLFTFLKRFTWKVSSPLGFLPFVWRDGTQSPTWLQWSYSHYTG